MKSVKIDEGSEFVIDFYRLIDTIDINQTRVTDFYRFFDTDFYPLFTPRIERKSW